MVNSMRLIPSVFLFFVVSVVVTLFSVWEAGAENSPRKGPVVILEINGPINPATDDYLKSGIKHATSNDSRLVVLKLNTPGGLVTSMQSMVQTILDSPVPIAVYVSPAGGSATSAGVFITMAGHVAAMAPGTTIGAAHPVDGGGQDVQGDMRAKIENFAVSLIKAIAEQRKRNTKWAEQAVRDSVSITDREAIAEKVVDLSASDLDRLLEECEGLTVTVKGTPLTLVDLKNAPRVVEAMSFKQKVVNVLADPNVTILLGLAAMLGIGIELYHPGAMLPGVVGVICLLLSLGSAQVLPIDYTGLGLILLGAVFFIVELFVPTFGLWGVAGIICLILGAIYLIDEDMVYGYGGYAVDKVMVGSVAGFFGFIMLWLSFFALRSRTSRVVTGREGLVGKAAVVKVGFTASPDAVYEGKVAVHGELWRARLDPVTEVPEVGETVTVLRVEPGMVLIVSKGR